jgi:hypothetical protein
VCKKRIATAADGVGCVACEQAYHPRCLVAPETCPKCEQNMRALEAAAVEAEVRQRRRAALRGRTFVRCAVAPFALLEATLLGLALSRSDGTQVIGTIVRIGIEAMLVRKMLNGSLGARRFLGFCFCCGAWLAAAVLLLVGASATTAPLLVLGVLLSGYAFWVLRFSADARVYLDSAGDI